MICYKCLQKITKSESAHHGLHPKCFIEWFNLSHDEEFNDVALRQVEQESGGEFKQIASSFFQGKFKKYSAVLGINHYILKIQVEDYPELPRVEYLSNQLADLFDLEVPPFYLIKFQNEVESFVTKSFIQSKELENLVHIYRFFGKNQLFNCENLLKIIRDETEKEKELEFFVKMCLFDALIGNHDRHGRNLGLIRTNQGYRLAPMYDNPSYLGIEDERLLNAQLEPRGKIATKKTDEPTMKDYVIEFKRLGFEDIINHFYKMINLEKILYLTNNSLVSKKRVEAMNKLIIKRHKELENELFS